MSPSETNPVPESPAPRSPRKPRSKQSVPISVFLGLMVVPLAAAASMFLVSPQIEEPAAQAAAPSPAAAEAAVSGDPDLAQDLVAACGPVATEMIELEKAGTLTALQAAALDALRPICSQEGMPLPESPDSLTVQAVLTRSASVASAAPTVGSGDDGEWDDDDRDDDDDWDDSLDSHDSEDWDD